MSTYSRASSAIIEQYDREGEPGDWTRPQWSSSLCGYCRKPVTLEDGNVEILSDHEESVSYPDERVGARCILTHGECGPAAGYWVPLVELASDGDGRLGAVNYDGWMTHLRCKVWFGVDVARGLEFARETAKRLRAKLLLAEAKPPKDRPDALRLVPVSRPANANPRSISVTRRALIMERDHFTCRRCGRKPPEVTLAVDHVVPVAKGGSGDDGNLQTLCRDCNAGKSDRDPHPHDSRAPEGT